MTNYNICETTEEQEFHKAHSRPLQLKTWKWGQVHFTTADTGAQRKYGASDLLKCV